MQKIKKKPVQMRSQSLFNAIVDSATRVLPDLGYVQATTNKIAHRAGVSIGSLYQYFPDKDSIFATLLDRELERQVAEIRVLIEQNQDYSLEECIDAIVSRFVAIYLERKALSRELFLNATKMGKVGEILYVRNEVGNLFTELVTAKLGLDPHVAKMKVFICLNAFMGIIQTYSLLGDEPMSREDVKNQISELLKSYLINP